MHWGLYALGASSFLPLLGLPLGVAAVIGGLIRRALPLFALGAIGLSFNLALYGSLFYFTVNHHGGTFDKLREQAVVTLLNNTVKEIEFYKLVHGHYPDSLRELSPKGTEKSPFVIDPTAV